MPLTHERPLAEAKNTAAPGLTLPSGGARIAANMANPDRLSALDSTFLHLEHGTAAHMHVASVMLFDGPAPSQEELVDHVLGRMDLVPRYRQRLA